MTTDQLNELSHRVISDFRKRMKETAGITNAEVVKILMALIAHIGPNIFDDEELLHNPLNISDEEKFLLAGVKLIDEIKYNFGLLVAKTLWEN